MYFKHVLMRFRLRPDGSALIATVTAIRDVDSSGNPVPLSGSARVGDQWEYRVKPNGALNEHQIKPPADPTLDDNAYCTTGIEDPACGA